MKFASNTSFLKPDPAIAQDHFYYSRLDREFLDKRRALEKRFATPQGQSPSSLKRLLGSKKLLYKFLKLTGLYNKGLENSFKLNVTDHSVVLKRLPFQFDGYRILHLSDLHLDMHSYYFETLKQTLRRVDYDVCVITGDLFSYYQKDSADHESWLYDLFHCLGDQVYVVLGNHDSIDMLPVLEDIGYKVLINEAVHLYQDMESIILSGVDDPHYFKLHSFKYYRSIDRTKCSILLAHSPELYKQAAALGVDYYLCGHTHGGQICLPGNIPLVKNARCPRRMVRGAWRYQNLLGYTSVGSGSSHLPVRFQCKPEITLHHLKSI